LSTKITQEYKGLEKENKARITKHPSSGMEPAVPLPTRQQQIYFINHWAIPG
jgi:hypothetical protein